MATLADVFPETENPSAEEGFSAGFFLPEGGYLLPLG